MNRRTLLIVAAGMLALPVMAGSLGDANAQLQAGLSDVVSQAGDWLGGVMVMMGGARAAWAASHGNDWTTPLIQAIFGTAIVAGASL